MKKSQLTKSDDAVVERVARAIAKGCNLDPDAISPKAAKVGHEIPEWNFFTPAARAAIEAMPATNSEAVSELVEALERIGSKARTASLHPSDPRWGPLAKQMGGWADDALAKLGSRAHDL